MKGTACGVIVCFFPKLRAGDLMATSALFSETKFQNLRNEMKWKDMRFDGNSKAKWTQYKVRREQLFIILRISCRLVLIIRNHKSAINTGNEIQL